MASAPQSARLLRSTIKEGRMTRRWFDGTVLVVSLFLVAWGGLARPYFRKKLNEGSGGPLATTVETAAVIV